MAQHKPINREEQEKLEEEARNKKKANQPLYGRFKAGDEGIARNGYLVEPSANDHAVLLSDISSDEQRASLITRLQQSYGNAYVQRVMKHIQEGKDTGQPLEVETRFQMEASFKEDFGDVGIHVDDNADRLAKELGAKAVTLGKDIFFKEGAYQPNSEAGKGLLGHELAHVVQQESSSQAGQRPVGRIGDALEEEATWVGQAASKGHPVSIALTSAAPAIQLQVEDEEEEEETPAQAAKEPEEEAKDHLTEIVANLASEVKKDYIKGLWQWAAVCQELGMEAEAKDAINEAVEKTIELLKNKVTEFDVESAKEEMLKGLLNAAAAVLAAGGDYEKVQPAMEAALEWAMNQLTKANEELMEAPPEEREEKARQVLINAGHVILLGGDEKIIDEVIKAVVEWAESRLDEDISDFEMAPSEEKAQEVAKQAELVSKLGGDTAKVDAAIEKIKE